MALELYFGLRLAASVSDLKAVYDKGCLFLPPYQFNKSNYLYLQICLQMLLKHHCPSVIYAAQVPHTRVSTRQSLGQQYFQAAQHPIHLQTFILLLDNHSSPSTQLSLFQLFPAVVAPTVTTRPAKFCIAASCHHHCVQSPPVPLLLPFLVNYCRTFISTS